MMIFENFTNHKDVASVLVHYYSSSNASVYKGVPIRHRERVLAYYKANGIKVKLRYRGPRIHGTQSYCTLGDATTFAVYPRTW